MSARGLEPPTNGLKGHCYTIELRAQASCILTCDKPTVNLTQHAFRVIAVGRFVPTGEGRLFGIESVPGKGKYNRPDQAPELGGNAIKILTGLDFLSQHGYYGHANLTIFLENTTCWFFLVWFQSG